MAAPRNARNRIHFGTSDQPEHGLPSLHLLVVSDLSPGGYAAPSTRFQIDKDSFNEVLRSLCPRITLQLESPFGSPIVAEFPVQDLKSFTPAQLAAAPFFRDLVRKPEGPARADGVPGPRSHTASNESPARPVQEKPGDVLDSILGMVDAPGSSSPASTSEGTARVQSFIEDMFGGSRRSSDTGRRRADATEKGSDAGLSAGLNDVLAHPEFRRLEAGWRGLKFLVDRAEFRDGIEIDVVAASKHGLTDVLATLLADVDAGAGGVDAVLAPMEFRNSPEDLEIARRAAEIAADLKAPLIVSVGAAFFGKDDAAEVTRIPQLGTYMESPPFVKWESFRRVESSRWLAAAFNRFLLRNAYDSVSARLPFAFREKGNGLWGDPVWALGSVLTASFSRTGWCGQITGVRGGGRIEDLPVREFELPSGDVRQIPLEALFLHRRENDFIAAGFLVLQCAEDQDVAALPDDPTVHHPERYSSVRETEESRYRAKLSYQLVTGRIARFVERELAQSGGRSPAEIQGQMAAALKRLLGQAAELQVALAESQERPGHYDLGIQVRPGPSILPLPVVLHMTAGLRRN